VSENERLRETLRKVQDDFGSIDIVCDMAGVHRFELLRISVNEALAAEPEVCVWTTNKNAGRYQHPWATQCKHHGTKWAWFKYCPGCGRKIEVKE